MSDVSVGGLELAVLVSVVRLGEQAYGLAVRQDLLDRTKRDYSVGAVYTTLERLQAKGLVTARMSEPLPIRGGRPRRQFKITGKGQRALHHAQQMTESMWSGLVLPRPRHA